MSAVAEGRIVGHWVLDERIGGGGQAAVHRARHAESGAPAAVKVFHRQVWSDPAFRVRFRRERDALSALEHPHIVPILDSGEEDGRGYLVMRLAGEGSLATRIATGPMRPGSALAILGGVADALDTAHAAGLLHRDVTPGNILLDPAGPWLADFGIARRIDATILTGEGQLIGTAGYMAPEVIGGARATAASDRYALAVVAFEVLTGRRLFEAEGLGGVLYAHAHRTPPRPSRVLARLPRGIDDVMGPALAKDPRERPASCRALIVSLERALGLGDDATRVMTRVRSPRRPRRRRVAAPLLGTLTVLASVGGGAFALTAALSDAPAPPPAASPARPAPAPLTIPTGDGGELSGSPVAAGDLPGDALIPGALAADVGDGVRVVAIRGRWAALRTTLAELRAEGFVTIPLTSGGRPVGVVAQRLDLSDITGQSPRWVLMVMSERGGSRALVAQGRHEAPADYAARLVRSSGDALIPLS